MARVGYIGGFGRSGSTLVERVVAAMPGVCALGEVRHLWVRGLRDNEACSCGALFHRCPFWAEVGERAFGGWAHVPLARIRELVGAVDRTRHIAANTVAGRRSVRAAHAREYADFYARVYDAAAEISGADVVIDSSKDASLAYALRFHEGITMRVVHLVRDSRGVAYSWTKSIARPEATARSQQPLMDRYSPWKSAVLWDVHNLAFEMLAGAGQSVLRVRYEDLLSRPADALGDIGNFLGLPRPGAQSIVDGDTVLLKPGHQVAGNPLRFRTGELRLQLDAVWRTELPSAQKRVVSGLTAPLLYRYGYVGRRPSELR